MNQETSTTIGAAQFEPLYLRQKQLARKLGLGLTTVQTLTRKRVIPVIKLGAKARLYDVSKVKVALEKLEQKAVGQ